MIEELGFRDEEGNIKLGWRQPIPHVAMQLGAQPSALDRRAASSTR